MGDEALEYFLTTPHKGKWTTIVQSLNDVTAEALLSFMSYRGGIKSRDLGLAIHNKSHPKLEEAGVDNFGAFLPQQRHTACKSRHRPWRGLKREDLAVVKGLGCHNKSHPKLKASFAIKMNISFIQGLFLTPLIRAHCLVRRITSLLSSLVKS